MELKLHSPCSKVAPLRFSWSANPECCAKHIEDTIRWVYDDLPVLKTAIEQNVLNEYDPTDFESMQRVCNRFNKAIDIFVMLEKGTSFPQKRSKIPSRGLLMHILQQTYIQAVEDPVKLNRYEAFSPQVYGETSHDFVFKMIDQIDITSKDVFIDLGSGVGHVVLQMAAATNCKICIGIEKAEIPCKYAENMNKYFKIYMNWYGKTYGKYKLIKGDFFDDKYKQLINDSSIVFVNNFAFGPFVDHKLKERFIKLENGTRIISSKNFCPLNFRISERNMNDVGAIMNVRKLNGTVSWTGKIVPYYLHVIDRSKLELYKTGNLVDNKTSIIPKWLFCVSSDSEKDTDDIKNAQSIISGDLSSEASLDDWLSPVIRKSCQTDLQKTVRINPCRKVKQTNPNLKLATIPNKFKPISSKFKRTQRKVEPKIPGLDQLLKVYKDGFTQMIQTMKTPNFKQLLNLQIKQEIYKNDLLKNKCQQIEDDIKKIINQNLNLIKIRMNELNLSDKSPIDLKTETKVICRKNYQLREQISDLEAEIKQLENQQISLLIKHENKE